MDRRETGKKARDSGYKAETAAAWFLRLKGYWILERNFKPPRGSGAGEIDIIAAKGGTIAFIEVKRRATQTAAAESVNARVQSRRVRGAEYYLATHPDLAEKELRFDVVLISPDHLPEHIQNAFWAE